MIDVQNTENKNNIEITKLSLDSDLQNKWQKVTEVLLKDIGDTAFNSWINPIEVKSVTNAVLEISAPTRFVRDWVKTHYSDKIRTIWSSNFDNIRAVEIIIAPSSTDKAEVKIKTAVNKNNKDEEGRFSNVSSPLDPRFTFKNFVVGKPNELAHAAAQRLASNEKVSFNPLYLYGGVGLGKTHLMHATAWAIKEHTPERKVVYMSAEKFMYQFIRALRYKDTMAFKEAFRSVDVLMIDDIQFLCGKNSTQEEFFHTLNSLIDQNKQIIVSSDQPPSNLDGLEERLRSRLGWGLVADIHPTTYELRLGILEQKRDMLNRDIPQDVLEFLAHKIISNVRELEGALNRIIAHSELVGCDITITNTQDLLQDLLRANDVRISIEDIQRKVAEHYNIRVSDLHSPRRTKNIARPRQVAMYLCKILTEKSLPDIGRKFGGRDHTTIIHGVRRIESLMKEDPAIREDVEILKRAF